jgi:hypothetical protein
MHIPRGRHCNCGQVDRAKRRRLPPAEGVLVWSPKRAAQRGGFGMEAWLRMPENEGRRNVYAHERKLGHTIAPIRGSCARRRFRTCALDRRGRGTGDHPGDGLLQRSAHSSTYISRRGTPPKFPGLVCAYDWLPWACAWRSPAGRPLLRSSFLRAILRRRAPTPTLRLPHPRRPPTQSGRPHGGRLRCSL